METVMTFEELKAIDKINIIDLTENANHSSHGYDNSERIELSFSFKDNKTTLDIYISPRKD